MSMHSMEPFESSENFNEDVGMFEAATHPVVANFTAPAITTIVVALDGTDQDETSKDFASSLAAQTGARVETVSGLTTPAEILSTVATHQASLLILPAPFGQNYKDLGSESLGSVADQVLLKANCPVLCIREPLSHARVLEALKWVLVPIAVADDLVPQAIGWGFQITPKGGRLDLIAVADRDVLTEAGHLIAEGTSARSLGTAELSRALLRDIGGVVAAAQKRGHSEDRKVHVETRVGKFVPLTLEELHGRPHMIIWCITRDHSSPAFHRAIDLLLASTGPVLMV